MKSSLKGNILLFITSLVWGTTFIFQRMAMQYIGPYTFGTFRMLICGSVLLPLSFIFDNKKDHPYVLEKNYSKKTIILIILIGLSIFFGNTLQQVGLLYTTASKSGFLTSVYIVFVPLLGLFVKNKVHIKIWICIVIALLGSYLLSMDGNMYLQLGDILTFIGAFFFATQIFFVDRLEQNINPVRLCAYQFLIAGILSIIPLVIFEKIDFNLLLKALPMILYASLVSGGIGYTLQLVGQKYTSPTLASLILSLESVFSLICGIIFLKEKIELKGFIGALLIFSSVIISSIDFKSLKKNKKENL